MILDDEGISGIIREEEFSDDVLRVLELLQEEATSCTQVVVEIHSIELYEEISRFDTKSMMVRSNSLEIEAMVNTKYKTVAKKVKPVATQLPPDSEDHIKRAEGKPRLRGIRRIGHKFTKETLDKLKIEGDEFLNEAEKKKFQ